MFGEVGYATPGTAVAETNEADKAAEVSGLDKLRTLAANGNVVAVRILAILNDAPLTDLAREYVIQAGASLTTKLAASSMVAAIGATLDNQRTNKELGTNLPDVTNKDIFATVLKVMAAQVE